MSGDYSRKIFKPNRNYSGVLMQQGRVLLDADWNNQTEINLRRQRAQTVDSIGRAVVPMETPDAFRLELNAGELSIFPGRMYVDGLLAENHGASPDEFYAVLDEERGTAPVLYQNQPFFPNAQVIDPLPTFGSHIAYLDVWQRELTYVMQPDLVEPAVGVDTTARWQTVWQVKVLEIDPQQGADLECGDQVDAWDALIAPSAGRLTTEIVEAQEEDDICLVPTEGGYRALENRLYRVEVHDGGGFDTATFKWARHNASIETAVLEIDGSELLVAQSHWDESRRFNQDGWVEITDDVRELAGESGEIRRITSIDYASNTITISSPLPAADFPTTPTNGTLPDRHTRIKRWDQNAEVDPLTGLLTVSNTPFYLEAGIQLAFSLDASPDLSGQFKTGDYWVFYARSATATIELLDQAPPRGIHHHYARLAILNFPDDQEDCRPHWPPEFGGSCCTVTVGDGEISHGLFTSIQDAINQLPITGGKVCVLPGEFRENFAITGRQNVTISGCGDRTRIISENNSDNVSDPVILIEGSSGIRIETLLIESNQQGQGILIRSGISSIDDVATIPCDDVAIKDLTIFSGFGSAVHCESGSRISICDNRISMRDEQTEWPGVFVIGEDVEIVGNDIGTLPDEAGIGSAITSNLINAGRGGIQLGGTVERANVSNNNIRGGRGDGITLGSLSLVDDNEIVLRAIVASIRFADDICQPCAPPNIVIPPRFEIEDDGGGGNIPDPPVVVSAGTLYDIAISGNHIEGMGRNGIGVVGFFDLEESDEFISVENLTISHNHIEGCLNRPLPEVESELEDDIGYGGIALGDTLNLVIHHNEIIGNGLSHLDPICGIYGLHCEGVEICDNRVLDNGIKQNERTGDERKGARSGIHLVYAIAPTEPLFTGDTRQTFPRQNGVPAAKIHNNIVSHPVGRALTINALGPVSVTDNQLTSRGILRGQPSSIASTVAILNLGVSNELYQQIFSFAQMTSGAAGMASMTSGISNLTAESATLSQPGLDDFRVGRYLANGNVMFSNNQVVLDELDTISNFALSAVAIFSLDDVAFNDNQCDYSLWTDFLIFPNFLYAPSVRASDNRFKEGFLNALLSGVTFGFMNTTTDNHSTHCLIAIGLPGMRVFEDNVELWDAIMGNFSENLSCAAIRRNLGRAFNQGEG